MSETRCKVWSIKHPSTVFPGETVEHRIYTNTPEASVLFLAKLYRLDASTFSYELAANQSWCHGSEQVRGNVDTTPTSAVKGPVSFTAPSTSRRSA